jgi:hypothetical protein
MRLLSLVLRSYQTPRKNGVKIPATSPPFGDETLIMPPGTVFFLEIRPSASFSALAGHISNPLWSVIDGALWLDEAATLQLLNPYWQTSLASE